MTGALVRGLACLALTGCATFEDPTIVLDLRVLAMTADVPEQIVDVDLERPDPALMLAQLRDTEIVALVADPGNARPLRWSMTLCLVDDEGRCDRTRPFAELGAGVIEDPEDTYEAQRPRASILATVHAPTLLAIITAAVEDNPVEALGGVQYTVVLGVGDVDDRSTDVYAAKHLRMSPRVPAARMANRNPSVMAVDAALSTGAVISVQANIRCGQRILDGQPVPRVPPGARLTLFPVEPDDVREDYVVPTLDGNTAQLKETITYQWLATYGAWTDEFTGGGHDALGNQSLLGSDWVAPRNVSRDLLVSLWMIQRDERLGGSWYETCVLVSP